MPRQKGEVWKYFQECPEPKNGSVVECSECGVRLTRGSAEASRGSLNSSSLVDHLRRNHSEVLEKIENSKAEKRKIEEEEEDSEMEILPPEREFLVHHSGTVGFVSGHGFIF